jgi:hypothetical protein
VDLTAFQGYEQVDLEVGEVEVNIDGVDAEDEVRQSILVGGERFLFIDSCSSIPEVRVSTLVEKVSKLACVSCSKIRIEVPVLS